MRKSSWQTWRPQNKFVRRCSNVCKILRDSVKTKDKQKSKEDLNNALKAQMMSYVLRSLSSILTVPLLKERSNLWIREENLNSKCKRSKFTHNYGNLMNKTKLLESREKQPKSRNLYRIRWQFLIGKSRLERCNVIMHQK